MVIKCKEEARKAILPAFPKEIMEHQECFVALALDSRSHPLGDPWLVAVGTLSQVEVHPRDVFREAIKRNARSVIVAHNHPSGVVEPSQEDHALTENLEKASKILGITLLDHLILGKHKSFSFAEYGRL